MPTFNGYEAVIFYGPGFGSDAPTIWVDKNGVVHHVPGNNPEAKNIALAAQLSRLVTEGVDAKTRGTLQGVIAELMASSMNRIQTSAGNVKAVG